MPVGAGFIPARIGENKKMTEHKKLQPEIRFAGFTDDWEQRKLGDICNITTGKLDANAMVENGKYDFFTSGIKKYKIDHYAFLGPALTIAGNGATVGYMHYADGFFNAYQRTYVLTELLGDRTFLFSTINRTLQKKIQQEARAGNIPYIVLDMLTELDIYLPSLEEQTQIGNFFKQLDDTIALHQGTLEKYQKLKISYLEKMFPKGNERYPELRFPNFTDAWEQCKLGNIADVRDGTHSSPIYYEEGFPLVTSKNLKENGLDLTDVSFISMEDYLEINKRSKVNYGDILLGLIGTIGNPVLVDSVGFAIKNVGLIKNSENFYKYFLIQILKSSIFENYVSQKNTGNTQKFLGLDTLRNFQFLCPSKEEQTQIGNFFKQLDDTIALHQREVEKYKKIKQSYLEKMFI